MFILHEIWNRGLADVINCDKVFLHLVKRFLFSKSVLLLALT